MKKTQAVARSRVWGCHPAVKKMTALSLILILLVVLAIAGCKTPKAG
jgi:hypothetical protein